MRAAVLSFVLALGACATGANNPPADDDDDAPVEPDAASIDDPRPDARVTPDAEEPPPPPDAEALPPPPDAEEPPPPPDAGGTTGPFCFSNAECPASDDCCVGFGPGTPGFCAPGTELGDFCLPD